MGIRYLFMLALGMLAFPAWAETTQCTPIQSLPARLGNPGIYCLAGDLSTGRTAGTAIRIDADDVVLDCNHHAIDGALGGLSTRTVGIGSERAGVTVKNCGVSGFYIGININGERGLVQSNRLSANTAIGVSVRGDGGVVRGNRVFDTGIFTADGAGQSLMPIGIATGASVTAEGSGGATVDVVDNVVARVRAPAGSDRSAFGIRTRGGASSLIARNSVHDVAENGYGLSFGIANVSAFDIIVRGNVISDASGNGVRGIYCSGSAMVVGNIVRGFVKGWGVCTNGGGNVHVP